MIRPKTARRERIWLEAVDLHYFTPQEIADAAGLSLRRIQAGLKRAREMQLDFISIWEIEWRMTPNAFTQQHQCEWHNYEDIPAGFKIGCLACMRTGIEHLVRNSRAKSEPPRTRTEKQKSFAERHHKGKNEK